jgi:hypothetical protein
MDWTAIGIILAFLGGSGVSTIIVKIIDLKSKKKDCRDAVQIARDDVLMALSSWRLVDIMQDCISYNEIDIHTYKHCAKLYKAYKILGGNDLVDDLWKRCQELPIKPEQ